jgi:hypothetical protein
MATREISMILPMRSYFRYVSHCRASVEKLRMRTNLGLFGKGEHIEGRFLGISGLGILSECRLKCRVVRRRTYYLVGNRDVGDGSRWSALVWVLGDDGLRQNRFLGGRGTGLGTATLAPPTWAEHPCKSPVQLRYRKLRQAFNHGDTLVLPSRLSRLVRFYRSCISKHKPTQHRGYPRSCRQNVQALVS